MASAEPEDLNTPEVLGGFCYGAGTGRSRKQGARLLRIADRGPRSVPSRSERLKAGPSCWAGCFLVAIVLVTVMSAPTARAQNPIPIGPEPRCPLCVVQLEYVVTLGDDDGPGLLGETSLIERDSRGRYYIAHTADRGVIEVFDSSGRFLDRIGREGGGPGEYRFVQILYMAPGDTLHVFDVLNRRRTVLSPSYEVVRTHPVPMNLFPGRYAPVDEGEIVLNGILGTPAGFGFPFHRIDATGKVVVSFGTYDELASPRTLYSKTLRPHASAGGKMIWAGFRNRYVLELWDSVGTRRKVLVRSAEWFQPYDLEEHVPGALTPVEPPYPLLRRMRQLPDGYIWVMIRVADPRWRRSLERRIGADGPYYSAKSYTGMYDTVIEVIDPEDARLIISERVDHVIRNFIDDEHVFSVRGSPGDVLKYDVWRIRIREP